MINKLKNCLKTTLIGLLPDIINGNNQAINAEFDWIFDTSLNRLKRSLYAPTGSVKAHFGEFTNLSCEYLTVKNADSLFSTVYSDIEKLIRESIQPYSYNSSVLDPSLQIVCNHELLTNRFADSDFEGSNYAHDAGSIIYQLTDSSFITVKEMLDLLDSSQFAANLAEIENDIIIINSSIDEINSHIDSSFQGLSNIYYDKQEVDGLLQNVKVDTLDAVNNINSSISRIKSILQDVDEYAQAIDSSLNDFIGILEEHNESIDNLISDINSSISNINNLIAVLTGGKARVNLDNSLEEYIIKPNVYYAFTEIPLQFNSISISKSSEPENTSILNEYTIRIPGNTVDGQNQQVSFDSWGEIIWENNNQPIFASGHEYEIRIVDNFASYKDYYSNL